MNLANEGNVGALKELGKMLEKSDLMGMERKLRHSQEAEDQLPAPPKAVGKKEAANAAAKTAGQGSDWGDDLLPGVLN